MTPWLAQPWFQPDGSSEEVMRGLRRMAWDLGVDHFFFVMPRGADGLPRNGDEPVSLSNLPRRWRDRYAEREYHRLDPVLQLASRKVRPFYWWWEEFPRSLPKAQRRVLVEAGQYGLLNGLAIPVRGTHGSFGVLGLVDADAARLRSATLNEHGRLWAVALDVHDFLLGQATGPNPVPNLSERERVCLALTLEGYEASRVSAEIGLSKFSVNKYVSSAQRKLGCGNKFEAAMQAMRLGLL